jgi:hypothetical protein
MLFDTQQEEVVAWPSYVDFMSTFIFVLIMFIGTLLFILSGAIGDHTFRESISQTEKALTGANIAYSVNGKRIIIPLTGQVKFDSGCPDQSQTNCKDNDDLSKDNQNNLRKVASIIAKHPGWKRIIIEGRADNKPYTRNGKVLADSKFRNFELSSRRALQVLKFFHECPGCDKPYDKEAVQPKLVLSGLGSKVSCGKSSDTSTAQVKPPPLGLSPRSDVTDRECADQDLRRVDVVLDYSEGLE